MTKKYKVNELAKDLGIENKAVIEILKQLGGEPKKATAALTEEELDFALDRFTAEKSAPDFDAYFAQGAVQEEEKAPPQEEAPAAGKPAAKQLYYSIAAPNCKEKDSFFPKDSLK